MFPELYRMMAELREAVSQLPKSKIEWMITTNSQEVVWMPWRTENDGGFATLDGERVIWLYSGSSNHSTTAKYLWSKEGVEKLQDNGYCTCGGIFRKHINNFCPECGLP